MSPNPSPVFYNQDGSTSDHGNKKGDSTYTPLSAHMTCPTPRSRSVLGLFRKKKSQSSISSSVTEAETEVAVPDQFVKTFLDTMSVEKFSNFMTWFQYYDIVELPESPSHWYRGIEPMEMRGWIALGKFLTPARHYGLSLVVLDTICDRLRLKKSLVRDCIAQIGDHHKMIWTQAATVIREAKNDHRTEVETLEEVQLKLQQLRSLVSCLRPTPDSRMSDWQVQVKQRLSEFLIVVVNPKIARLREVASAPTGRSDEDEKQLKFLWEALQQDRQVPLIRYGIFPDPLAPWTRTGSTSTQTVPAPILDEVAADLADLEESYSVQGLKKKLRTQHDQIFHLSAELRTTIEKLQNATSSRSSQSTASNSLSKTPPANTAEPDRSTTDAVFPSRIPRGRSHVYSSSVDSPGMRRKGRAPFMFPQTPTRRPHDESSMPSENPSNIVHAAPDASAHMLSSSASVPSSEYDDVFAVWSSSIATFPGLMDPTTGADTPPTSPRWVSTLPRNIGTNNLPALAPGLTATTTDAQPNPLPRNTGVPDLRAAAGVGQPADLLSSDPTTPQHKPSQKSSTSPRTPSSPSSRTQGPHNSLLENRARQVNDSTVQLPSAGPSSPRAIAAAKDLIRRSSSKIRLDALKKNKAGNSDDGSEKKPRKSRSISSVVSGLFRRYGNDEEGGPNPALNF